MLERRSAKGLYREVFETAIWLTINSLTSKTSRYNWIPATAGVQSLEVTVFIPEGLTNSHVLALPANQVPARLYRVCVNSKPMIFWGRIAWLYFQLVFLFFCLDAKAPIPKLRDKAYFYILENYVNPLSYRWQTAALMHSSRCTRRMQGSTAHRCGIYLFYYRCKKYAGCKHLISDWKILVLFWYSFSSV